MVEATVTSERRLLPTAIAELLFLSQYTEGGFLTCSVVSKFLCQENAAEVKAEMELFEFIKSNPLQVLCYTDRSTEALAAEILRLTTLTLEWYGNNFSALL